jgi:putative hydroxymethylpyrimidine transport system substrate-binding protein
MRHIIVAAAAALLAAVALTACGAKTDRIQPLPGDTQPLSLELDQSPNADHVGIYEAQAGGEFRTAGLDVQIHAPTAAASPLALLESGKVDVAVLSEPQLMLARSRGDLVLGFGAIVQRPLSSIIAVGARHIHSVTDLRGKTVGTAGLSYQSAYLKAILARAHVPSGSVTQVNVGSDLVGAMLSGRVDATLGGFSNAAGIELRQTHRHPTVIPVSRAGVPVYDELVLVTTEVFFAKHNNLLRRFVQALGRGYTAVRQDPAAGVAALDAANPSLTPAFETAAVNATLPAFFPAGGRPWGWQNQQQWNAYGRWATDHHIIDGPRAWAAASTNQLLAGQGP